MKSIWVAGDFFSDEFNVGSYRGDGPRFVVDETVRRPGGAANTMANARAICRNTAIHCFQAGYSPPRTLRRWVQDGATVFEYWDVQEGTQAGWGSLRKRNPSFFACFDFKTLVVSEYNKGFSTVPVRPGTLFDLLVVDSRYRTAPIEELKHGARTTVWRCTAEEYNFEWAKHFDWVVHTAHHGTVKIYSPNIPGRYEYQPPPTKVVDPVGAGDTFTVALAAYLTDQGVVDDTTMQDAVQFATRAAQNVCGKQFTATTDVRLES